MPDAIDKEADFYGTEIIFHADGSKTVRYRGGYKPRLLTDAELRPWLDFLFESFLDEEQEKLPESDNE